MEVEAQKQLHAFHLAIPTNNLLKSKQFYGQILGCPQGRTDPARWIDYNFFGSQLVCHFATSTYIPTTHFFNQTPIPNFGVHVTSEQLNEVKQKLANKNIAFNILASSNQKVSEILHVQDPTGNNILFHSKKQ